MWGGRAVHRVIYFHVTYARTVCSNSEFNGATSLPSDAFQSGKSSLSYLLRRVIAIQISSNVRRRKDFGAGASFLFFETSLSKIRCEISVII